MICLFLGFALLIGTICLGAGVGILILRESNLADEFSADSVCNSDSSGFAEIDQVFDEAIGYLCGEMCPCKMDPETAITTWDPDEIADKYFSPSYTAINLLTCNPSESPNCISLAEIFLTGSKDYCDQSTEE